MQLPIRTLLMVERPSILDSIRQAFEPRSFLMRVEPRFE